MNRSTAKQIEFWAEWGKRVAHSITNDELLVLMQGLAKVHVDISASLPIDPEKIFAAVNKANSTETLGQQITHGNLYYEASQSRPGSLDQVMPDGTRRVGRFKDGMFVPE